VVAVGLDADAGVFEPRPIAFRKPGERIFLILYGTGFRALDRPEDAALLWNGDAGPPLLYIGPQGEFPGLDQLNIELTRELVGAGAVDVQLSTAEGRSNELRLQVE